MKVRSLKFEILISALLITIACILLIGILFSSVLISNGLQQSDSFLEHRNRSLYHFMNGFFTEIRNTAVALSKNPLVQNASRQNPETHSDILNLYKAYIDVNPNIYYLFSGYPDGLMLINDWDVSEDFIPAERPWYKLAESRRSRVQVSDPYHEFGTTTWLVATSLALFNENGDFSGVIGIDCSINTLSEALLENQYYDTENNFVINSEGIIIIHSDKSLLGELNDAVFPHILSDKGHLQYTDNGVKRLAYYSKIATTEWFLISEIQESEIIASVFRKITVYVFLLFVFFAGLGWLQSRFLGTKFIKPLVRAKPILEDYSRGDFTTVLYSQNKNEIDSMLHSINAVITKFIHIIHEITNSSKQISESTHSLTSSSQETSAVTNQQAAAVKEMVSTMEDADLLSKNIDTRIREVTKTTVNSRDIVHLGFRKVKMSMDKMNEINTANQSTIEGILFLNEKISKIGEIVKIINGVADQTKIIAFNAELEAAAAGDAGKNFQIVASEIRRLADSTVKATNEIRDKITEIQKSSDRLLLTSENGTEKIQEGNLLSRDINNMFQDILQSTEASTDATSLISESIRQQVSSFEQFLVALKQISEGVENAALSTKETSRVADILQELTVQLNALLSQFTIAYDDSKETESGDA